MAGGADFLKAKGVDVSLWAGCKGRRRRGIVLDEVSANSRKLRPGESARMYADRRRAEFQGLMPSAAVWVERWPSGVGFDIRTNSRRLRGLVTGS